MGTIRKRNKQKVRDPKLDRLKTVPKIKVIIKWMRNIKSKLVG